MAKLVQPPEICKMMCGEEVKPVCGSDGKTYKNPCLFNCMKNKKPELQLAWVGECLGTKLQKEIHGQLTDLHKKGDANGDAKAALPQQKPDLSNCTIL